MPRAKTTTKKAPVAKTVSLQTKATSYYSNLRSQLTQVWGEYKGDKRVWVGVVVLGLLLLGVARKEWFVAATVNGKPISNFTVQKRLNEQFKSQVVSQMVDERIIKDEAKNKGITITPADVDQKISALETQFGGAQVLDSLLSQQGQTREGLRKNLELQIIIEKLYSSEATVSAEEVDQYLAQNGQQLQATDEAAQRKEAEDQLKQQKLGQLFSQKFQQLKEAAKVKLF